MKSREREPSGARIGSSRQPTRFSASGTARYHKHRPNMKWLEILLVAFAGYNIRSMLDHQSVYSIFFAFMGVSYIGIQIYESRRSSSSTART